MVSSVSLLRFSWQYIVVNGHNYGLPEGLQKKGGGGVPWLLPCIRPRGVALELAAQSSVVLSLTAHRSNVVGIAWPGILRRRGKVSLV